MRAISKVCLTFAAILLFAAAARADVVTDWNLTAVQTAGAAVPARPGPSAILDVATVHAAMHDAIQAYEHRYESYAPAIPGATGSPIAAAAQAAHDVLVAHFPAQAPGPTGLDQKLLDYLAGKSLLGDPGVAIGHEAATRVLALRANDGSFPTIVENFIGGTGPGEWRPTLPAFAPMAAPWLGAVQPFALKDSAQLGESTPPTHLASGEYLRDYNEVKALGSLNSTARTQAQTDLALFYSDNLPALWQRTLRNFAGANVTDLGDSGRLFALAEIATADALINAWHEKKYWNFWRPITAIREGDNDGNPRTVGDAGWLPQIPTPPYADYTSGANNLTGAMTGVLERLFGDQMSFDVFSTPANKTKTYQRFSDMADDMVDVRVYQGIHFRRADEVARRQGTRSADWTVSHVLRPIN